MSGPADTVWSGNEEGEFTQTTANDIADSTNNQLVDASGNNLIDGGATFTATPLTTWTVNDTA